jgi:hypothetical protein
MGIQLCKHEHKQRARYEVTHDINLATLKFEHRILSRNMCLVRDAIVQCFYIYILAGEDHEIDYCIGMKVKHVGR